MLPAIVCNKPLLYLTQFVAYHLDPPVDVGNPQPDGGGDAPPPGPAGLSLLSFIFPLTSLLSSFPTPHRPIHHTTTTSSLVEHSDDVHTPKETISPFPLSDETAVNAFEF